MKEKLWVLLSWGVVAGAAAGVLARVRSSGWVSQPAPFTHKKHVDWGVACESCHLGAKAADQAGIPNVRVCALCHVPGKASPKTPPELAAYINGMKEIAWGRVYRITDHVRFSHARHARSKELDCVVCHGKMSETDKALRHRLVRLDMNFCMDCHRREKVTTDCLACHR